MKTDIVEANKGDQCGVSVVGFNDWKVNDRIKIIEV